MQAILLFRCKRQLMRGRKQISLSLQGLLDQSSSFEQYRDLARQTLDYLRQANVNSIETKSHLMDIMMAQDFQDLTGHVIKKVTKLVQNVEQQSV